MNIQLQAETAAELDALLPAILPSSPGFDATGDRAFTRLHRIPVFTPAVAMLWRGKSLRRGKSARREGEL